MTILGVDLSSNNGPFNFPLAYQQGCRAAYIKLGGDNIPRYVSGSYAARVDQARAAGMIVGHYWVTGGHDPEAAAAFFVRNLRNVGPSDFFVLDNEKLDQGNMYSDDEAARWIRTVQRLVGGAAKRVFMYASGSPMQGSSWAGVRATGAQALVAWYGRAPFNIPMPLGHWPVGQIGGHQYTSSGSLGGISPVDLNVFTSDAFDYTSTASTTSAPIEEEDDMKFEIGYDPKGGQYILGPQGVSAIPNASVQLPLFQRLVKGERTFTAAEWKAIDETLNRRL